MRMFKGLVNSSVQMKKKIKQLNNLTQFIETSKEIDVKALEFLKIQQDNKGRDLGIVAYDPAALVEWSEEDEQEMYEFFEEGARMAKEMRLKNESI